MTKVSVLVNGIKAGVLEKKQNNNYTFLYFDDYKGPPVSLTMPISTLEYTFDNFPSFFDGLLPEGIMLEALLRKYKIDKADYLKQLLLVGKDVVGSVTVEEFM